jgi:hypothetical protein
MTRNRIVNSEDNNEGRICLRRARKVGVMPGDRE